VYLLVASREGYIECRDLLFPALKILVFVAVVAAAGLMNVKPARKKIAPRQVRSFEESRKMWMTFSSVVEESVYLLVVGGCYDEESALDVENLKCTALAKMPTLA